MKLKRYSLDEFKQAAKSAPATVADAAIMKAYACDEVRALDVQPGQEAEAKVFDFAISSEVPDRQTDAIALDGWKLDNYRKNPVVLWAHNAMEQRPPIATSPAVWPEASKLRAKADFSQTFDIDPFARMICQLIARKVINACSVGFQPIVYTFNEARGMFAMDFLEQELLEWSPCPVPANPDALQGAKSMGVDTKPLVEWAEKVLDGERGAGLWVPKELATIAQVAKARGIAAGSPVSVSVPAAIVSKAGRVLSSTNEQALRDAVAAIESASESISSVLDQVNPAGADPAEPGEEPVAGKAAESTVTASATATIVEPTPPSAAEIAAVIKAELPNLIREITKDSIEKAMRKAHGRID